MKLHRFLKQTSLTFLLSFIFLLYNMNTAIDLSSVPAAQSSHGYVAGQLILMFNSTDYLEQIEIVHSTCNNAEIIEHYDNYMLIQLPSDIDLMHMITIFEKQQGIFTAEPNYIISEMKLTDDTFST